MLGMRKDRFLILYETLALEKKALLTLFMITLGNVFFSEDIA